MSGVMSGDGNAYRADAAPVVLPPVQPPAALSLPGCAPHPRDRRRKGGFALPVAVVGALILLLGSLAAQSALHQSRLRHASALGQRRLEDALASAAHQLVGRLVEHHPCLLTLPLAAWPASGSTCADAAAQGRLLQGEVPALAYRLEGWEPAAGAPVAGDGRAGRIERIVLELSRRSGSGHPPWRAAFALDVQGDPPQVLALRELGLRGVRP